VDELSRHVVPVVHNRTAEMTEDEREYRDENGLERWIHFWQG
jgi:hypothetical protein